MDLSTAIRSFNEGRLGDADVACRQLLLIEPNNPQVLHLMGAIAGRLGNHEEAAKLFQQAIVVKPQVADFYLNLSVALEQLGRHDEAAAELRKAIELQPGDTESLCMLGNLLLRQGDAAKAIECYREALRYHPNLARAHHGLATAYRMSGAAAAAIGHYRTAIALDPRDVSAANDLSGLLLRRGALAEGIELLLQILRQQPGNALAHNNLGHAFRGAGQLEQAVASYQRALQVKPDYAEAHSNLVYLQQFLPDITLSRLLEAHTDWNRRHAAPLKSQWHAFDNAPDPERPLRLGFVSPDLGWHPVAYFFVDCLEALRAESCETLCYSDRADHDEMSRRIEAAAGAWRDVHAMSDEALAAQLRHDEVDVLFDLAGHTANNRLLVFARKPAPIQVSWLGYVGTTGLEAMDYLVADRSVLPEQAKPYYQERILWLPETKCCYGPLSEAPEVGPLPAKSSGYVTFGSINQPAKVTSEVLATWAEILRQVPRSRLILKYRGFDDGAIATRIKQFFAERQLDPERIELQGQSPHIESLAHYNGIDMALDPFPFSGATTTCEALWMGVPVVTRPLETFASRQSLGILQCIGLQETVASDLNDYVRIAVELAQDLPRLAKLRAGLRTRMAQSPLCDAERFAANFMQAVREVWRVWCEQTTLPPES